MKEFFGIGGYQRTPEGFLSWQHLTFATALMAIMVLSAILLGKQNKNKSLHSNIHRKKVQNAEKPHFAFCTLHFTFDQPFS